MVCCIIYAILNIVRWILKFNYVCICTYRNWHAPSDHCLRQLNVDWRVVLALVCHRPADRYRQRSNLLRPRDRWSLVSCLVMLGQVDSLSWATETISTHLGKHRLACVHCIQCWQRRCVVRLSVCRICLSVFLDRSCYHNVA